MTIFEFVPWNNGEEGKWEIKPLHGELGICLVIYACLLCT